jgi:hypothetical protein
MVDCIYPLPNLFAKLTREIDSHGHHVSAWSTCLRYAIDLTTNPGIPTTCHPGDSGYKECWIKSVWGVYQVTLWTFEDSSPPSVDKRRSLDRGDHATARALARTRATWRHTLHQEEIEMNSNAQFACDSRKLDLVVILEIVDARWASRTRPDITPHS